MDKVRPWCDQPSDRAKEQNTGVCDVTTLRRGKSRYISRVQTTLVCRSTCVGTLVHNLRSATMSLSQPSSRTTLANRAFRCSAPAVWNSLPKTLVDSDSVAVFKSKLKTFLFSQAYSLSSSHSY